MWSMPHLSENDLKNRIEESAGHIRVGAIYKHYKDKLYQVTGLAIIEENNQVGVIYQAQYGTHLTFIRPLSTWLEKVEKNGNLVPRFEMEKS